MTNTINMVDKTRAHASKHRVQVWNAPRKTLSPYLVKYFRLEYSRAAAAKSAAGFRTPLTFKAALRVFKLRSCAAVFAHPLQMWRLCYICNVSMVAQMGQPSGWPVSLKAGSANLVWATTQELRTSRGSNNRYFKEAAEWLRSSPKIISFRAPAVYSTVCIMNDFINPTDTLLDAWSICDSCRLLANALINPQNADSQAYLSLMMQTQLESLETALALPVPESWETLPPPADDGLFDNTELEPSELCDQCRALNYALIMLSNKMVKEVIAFVLCERIEMLKRSLYAPDGEHP
ncbi:MULTISPECIES: ash family protein [Rahnella]|uniref:Ash family protein n=1 Tax=Rahnella laticis TaxID=2787622 RepID=A0ABS0E757_9GAMM|nr:MULTISPECIES: ash family protein [Rahnella]MBF7979094.1 ash family protein [Rahnella laticis]MBF7999641.1 ash family protein [Rahnella sp. LAC-M12]